MRQINNKCEHKNTWESEGSYWYDDEGRAWITIHVYCSDCGESLGSYDIPAN